MKRFLAASSLFFLFGLGIGQTAHAQNPAMSLIGSVQSDERQPLPGAAITVIHLPSGVRHAAASDGTGRFVISNLMVGGPYTIRVGEGGYRPQTVENIFLETGKTANFTVVLNKLGEKKGRNNRGNEPTGPTLALANEAVVGGPVLMTTLSAPPVTTPAAVPVATANPFATLSSPVPTSTAQQQTAAPAAVVPTMAPHNATPATAMAAQRSAAPMAAAPRNMTPAAAMPSRNAAPTASSASATGNAVENAAQSSAAPVATTRVARYPSRYPARRPTTTRVADPIVPGYYDAKSGNFLYDTGQPTTLKLPGNGSIAGVGINSTESYLYRFLSDPKMQVDTVELTNGWYNFDKVFFNSGKATLTPESIGQLRNVATIMRAFPKARLKLGGYTDNTGDYKVNRQLSEARARTAWASLVEMGISPSRLEARGYGPGYAIAGNESDEGRAKNRRLSLRVIQK